jgi:hypothetical protein
MQRKLLKRKRVVNQSLKSNIVMCQRIKTYVALIFLTLILIGCKRNDLYNSKINGIIEKLSYSVGHQANSKNYMTLKINNREYKLTIASALGNEFSFLDVARTGDTVFKAKKNDTLCVTRAGSNPDVRFRFIVKEYISK